jgi:ssDNA-specific exonuclease RecJ
MTIHKNKVKCFALHTTAWFVINVLADQFDRVSFFLNPPIELNLLPAVMIHDINDDIYYINQNTISFYRPLKWLPNQN